MVHDVAVARAHGPAANSLAPNCPMKVLLGDDDLASLDHALQAQVGERALWLVFHRVLEVVRP